MLYVAHPMSRMIDIIGTDPAALVITGQGTDAEAREEFDGIVEEALAAVPVVIDNVAEYAFTHVLRDDDEELERAFPNCVPPHDLMWVEAATPKQLLGRGDDGNMKMFDMSGMPDMFGFAVRTTDFKDRTDWQPPKGYEGARWQVEFISLWAKGRRRVIVPGWKFDVYLDPTGRIIGKPRSMVVDWARDKSTNAMRMLTWVFLRPVLLAISFMNCKNVTRHVHNPSETKNRIRVKHGHKPLARYYTLHIDPMKQVLRTEGQIEKTGLKQGTSRRTPRTARCSDGSRARSGSPPTCAGRPRRAWSQRTTRSSPPTALNPSETVAEFCPHFDTPHGGARTNARTRYPPLYRPVTYRPPTGWSNAANRLSAHRQRIAGFSGSVSHIERNISSFLT